MNNAGIPGVMVDNAVSYKQLVVANISEISKSEPEETIDKAIVSENDTNEWAEQCLQTNYYGTKRVTEAFLPLLLLSHTPRIVNISSILGQFKNISNEWAIGVLSNVEELTEEKVDEVINAYLKDRKEGWPTYFSAYKLSKAAINAYTRIMAKKYPQIIINAVNPGFVRTDFTSNLGFFTPEEGAETSVNLALLPKGAPSGLFFDIHDVSEF
ncbi:dehydrogenase [Lithospermum erythrorhizon]|uniref:Dehydrogenase n=1 Tax=Lithospermum erythrorhizon TaxID=34254 RepID=A0AAV3RRG0_LITER